MTVSRGNVHKYLGMTLDYTVHGQVKITMIDYVDEILTAFDKADPKGGGTKTSAASENLFRIDEECEKLQPNKAVEFHNLVAKTLYATKCARPDTCTAIAFLMTRVQAPDKDDWTKLAGPFDEISQRHAQAATDSQCQQKRHFKMVGGRIICGPS
jgi:hypothetical protein